MKTIFLSLIFGLWLIGCTTYVVKPVSDKLVWEKGRGFDSVADARTQMRAALESQTPSYLIFQVEFENRSSQALDVSAGDLTLQGSAFPEGAIAAMDPEPRIQHLTEMVDHYKAESAPGFLENLSSLTSSIGARTEEQREKARQTDEENRQRHSEAQANADMSAEEKEELETKYLRRTTLAPGQKVTGLVKFWVSLKPGAVDLTYATKAAPLKIAFLSVEH